MEGFGNSTGASKFALISMRAQMKPKLQPLWCPSPVMMPGWVSSACGWGLASSTGGVRLAGEAEFFGLANRVEQAGEGVQRQQRGDRLQQSGLATGMVC